LLPLKTSGFCPTIASTFEVLEQQVPESGQFVRMLGAK
jgi:hypothetical protein